MCNNNPLISLFQKLVSIDSPSFGEREMADFLMESLIRLGFEVEEDHAGEVYGGNSGNLYAYQKGMLPGEPLLFSTHMDTVEPACGKQAILHEDGRITSDGTTVLGADCHSGTAALLTALKELKESNIPCRDLEVIFFIGEEKHLRGSAVFDFSKVKAKESYILDKSGPVGTAANQAPTMIDFQIKIQGKASHAGFAPEKGVHAIMIASRSIAKMEMGRVGEDTTVNVGGIHGGVTSTNVVPEHCSLIGEVRSFSHEKALAQMEKIKNIFEEEARKAGGNCTVEYEVSYRAYQTDEKHGSVRRFQRICKDLGLSGTIEKTFGGSDQANLSIHGIQGLVLASAMEKVHSCQEYTFVKEMEMLKEVVKRLIQDIEN